MKVCICSFTGYNSLNGSNLRAYFFSRELVRRGYGITFIVPSKEDANSCVEKFGANAKNVGLSIKRFKSSRLKKYPLYSLRASKLIDKNVDLIFGQSLPSALAVRLAKIKARKVIDYVDLWSEYWLYANPSFKGELIYRAIRRAEEFSMKKVNLAFTITNQLKKMMIERGCNPEIIEIVRDGVDLEMFYPLKVKDKFYEKYNLERSDEYIIYQGGIAAHDGVQFLVNAAPIVLKRNPNIQFLIVGTGSYLDKVKKQVDNLKLNKYFIFTGWVDYEDMPSFMNIAKVNVVPLPDSNATRSVVTYKLFEGIATGKPTVIGDLPGVREAVKNNETAVLVRSENKNELADAIDKLLNDKLFYNKIRRNGLKMVEHHDWRLIAKDMVNLIEHRFK